MRSELPLPLSNSESVGCDPIDNTATGISARQAVILIRICDFGALRRRQGVEVLELWLASRAEALQRQYGFAVASRAGRDVIRLETRVADVAGVRSIMSKSALAFADGDHDTSPVSLAIVAVLGGERQTRIDLIETAEEALSQIEDGNEPVIVDLSVSNGLPDEAALGRDLQVAENRGELFLVYQPKVAVRKRCIASAEALIRWQHPVHGVIMPDAFIPLAERNGSIRELTLWVLLKIIADQPSLTADGRPFRTFMNVSGHLLTDSHFIEAACRIVAETRAEIGFEITETSVIRDPELAIANLERCAEAGVALAIDDYGAGLSSLAYLKRLPAQELKIDKMFVTQLTSSHRDPLIVRSTIDLAHALGMEVTAEGVESPAALALLTVMGCEMVQGYLISPPLKLEEFQRYQTEFTFEALQSDGPRAVQRPASFWSRKSTA